MGLGSEDEKDLPLGPGGIGESYLVFEGSDTDALGH